MKIIRHLLLTSLALLAMAATLAAKPIPGPRGGRVVTTEAPHVEFFVAKDRSVLVSFYDKDLKPVAPRAQSVGAVVETKAGKVKLAFALKNNAFISTAPLPEGDDFTVVLQVRDTPEAKPKNHRIVFHDELCAGCKRAEYACTCEDAGGEGGHKH